MQPKWETELETECYFFAWNVATRDLLNRNNNKSVDGRCLCAKCSARYIPLASSRPIAKPRPFRASAFDFRRVWPMTKRHFLWCARAAANEVCRFADSCGAIDRSNVQPETINLNSAGLAAAKLLPVGCNRYSEEAVIYDLHCFVAQISNSASSFYWWPARYPIAGRKNPPISCNYRSTTKRFVCDRWHVCLWWCGYLICGIRCASNTRCPERRTKHLPRHSPN